MTRLGMLRITILMTLASALLSTLVAWILALLMSADDVVTHLKLAFTVPFFVTPPFSYLTAFALRESRHARQTAIAMARSDPLTGLYNRRAFQEFGDRSDRRTVKAGHRALLYLDIDHFKKINDTFGHKAGDAVLAHFAGLLTACCRKHDTLARFGGEEFVVLLEGCDTSGASGLAQRILARVRETVVRFEAHEIRFTVSIGIAAGASVEGMIADADAQLYRAKDGGRDRFSVVESAAQGRLGSPAASDGVPALLA